MTVEKYLSELPLWTDQRRFIVQQVVDQLAPRRTRWWQLWRYSDTYRYKLAFALVSFMTEARS